MEQIQQKKVVSEGERLTYKESVGYIRCLQLCNGPDKILNIYHIAHIFIYIYINIYIHCTGCSGHLQKLYQESQAQPIPCEKLVNKLVDKCLQKYCDLS